AWPIWPGTPISAATCSDAGPRHRLWRPGWLEAALAPRRQEGQDHEQPRSSGLFPVARMTSLAAFAEPVRKSAGTAGVAGSGGLDQFGGMAGHILRQLPETGRIGIDHRLDLGLGGKAFQCVVVIAHH